MAIYLEDLFKYNNYDELDVGNKWNVDDSYFPVYTYFPAYYGEDHSCPTVRGAKSGEIGHGDLTSYPVTIDNSKDLVFKHSYTYKFWYIDSTITFLKFKLYNSSGTNISSIRIYATLINDSQVNMTFHDGSVSTPIAIYTPDISGTDNWDFKFLVSNNYQTCVIYRNGIQVESVDYGAFSAPIESAGVTLSLGGSTDYDYDFTTKFGWIIRGLIISDELTYFGDNCLGTVPIIIKNNLIDRIDTHNGTYEGREYWKKSPLVCEGGL